MPKERRLGVVIVALLLAAVGAGLARSETTSQGNGVGRLVTEVRQRFGDRRIRSAFIRGSTLIVRVNAPDEPSAVSAAFEGQMLAYAVRAAREPFQTQIDAVHYVTAAGANLRGYGTEPVGTRPFASPLRAGACDAGSRAARAVVTGLTAESVVTLPYAGGGCAFTFRTSKPSSFPAPIAVGHLDESMGNSNDRPVFVEVDGRGGVPQFAYSWTPSAGGVAYTRPGSGILFGP